MRVYLCVQLLVLLGNDASVGCGYGCAGLGAVFTPPLCRSRDFEVFVADSALAASSQHAVLLFAVLVSLDLVFVVPSLFPLKRHAVGVAGDRG